MAYTAIDNPELYFQVVIWTGNDTDGRTITLPGDEDMQPNLVAIKNRGQTDNWSVFDSVRGANKTIQWSTTNAEFADASQGWLSAFTSDGFTVTSGSTDDGNVNNNTETYVAHCWKESATAGFDIVKYEGTASAKTEAHSLSAVPYMMLIKNLEDTGGTGTEGWLVYHAVKGATHKAGSLNDTGVPHDHTDYFNDVEPTSSVFTVGAGNNGNASGEDNIAYLFAPKQGFSKFGNYTGNGNADGLSIYTGFRPAFTMIKRIDGADDWIIHDNKRKNPFNPVDTQLFADLSNAESSSSAILDYCATGFKIRKTGDNINGDGMLYMYAAFAEAPFVNSEGVPCNAR